MLEFNENPQLYIERFSKEVQDTFLEMFRIKFGLTSFVPINKAYNEYIRDPYHTHLNSTKWASLSEFALELEQLGIIELTREPDASGTEQIMVRLIDKDKDKREALALLGSKEVKRELERKREQKDFEKMVKQAAKLQKIHEKSHKAAP